MAVYTEVTDAALEAFLGAYDVGRVLSFKGIAGGVENTNYLLGTESGQYILTLYEKRVAEEDLPFFVGLMDHLSAAGFPCPNPIRNRQGQALARLEDRAAAMVSFLDGVEVTRPQPAHCFAAGETMARLHAMASNFTIFRANGLSPKAWPALVNSAIEQADTVEDGMAALMKDALHEAQQYWPTAIPSGVIHADFFKDNVFFLNNSLSGVIDFYFACNDFLAYDLAVALNAWCFDKTLTFQPELANALVQGYQSIRPLEEAEINALPVLARGAALRFLLTRINDWLNVPEGALVIPHDPKQFSARLRYLRTIQSPQDLGAA
ncbi:MAG: homoserine kinase [Pseudomonadota bacterium]